MSSTSEKKIILISSDNQTFEIAEAVALELQTVKNMIEDDCADNAIPLPNVEGPILSKVIEYCTKHVEGRGTNSGKDDGGEISKDQVLKAWDDEFVKSVTHDTLHHDTLYHLLLAANYLNIKSLLDLTTQAVADIIKGKQPEEIRKIFGIANDFSPEEEEEIRKQNAWAFG